MTSYLVITCPACGRPRVVQEGPKGTTCPSCHKRHAVADARAHGRFEAPDAARAAVGRLNAVAAGDAGAVERDERLRHDVAPGPTDAIGRAVAAARVATPRPRRVELVVDGLTRELGHWSEDELLEALARLGIPDGAARADLQRLLASGRVTEARPGRYAGVAG